MTCHAMPHYATLKARTMGTIGCFCKNLLPGAFFPIWASAPRGRTFEMERNFTKHRDTQSFCRVSGDVSVPIDSSRFTQKWPLGAQRPPRKTCDSFNIFGDFGVIQRKIGLLTFECFESMARFIGPDLSNAQFPGWSMVNRIQSYTWLCSKSWWECPESWCKCQCSNGFVHPNKHSAKHHPSHRSPTKIDHILEGTEAFTLRFQHASQCDQIDIRLIEILYIDLNVSMSLNVSQSPQAKRLVGIASCLQSCSKKRWQASSFHSYCKLFPWVAQQVHVFFLILRPWSPIDFDCHESEQTTNISMSQHITHPWIILVMISVSSSSSSTSSSPFEIFWGTAGPAAVASGRTHFCRRSSFAAGGGHGGIQWNSATEILLWHSLA